MRTLPRNVIRVMAGWPVIGRLIRITVALVRLPEHNDRHHRFVKEQLPTLLQAMSDLNCRVLTAVQNPENLEQSMPTALRMLTRDLAELRERLDRIELQIKQ